MAKMKLNRRLNLVFPIETENGMAYIHSMPISREVFESNYLVLSMTFMEIYSRRLGPIMGPKVAYLVLRDMANAVTSQNADTEEDVWAKTQKTLVQEIYRMTNALIPNGQVYDTIPYMQVKQQKLIDEDDLREVDNALIYFTVASHLHQKSELPMAYAGLERLWEAQTTSLNITEYLNSLPTLKKAENTGETILAQDQKVLSKAF